MILQDRDYFYSNFKKQKDRPDKLSNIPKVTQLASSRAKI